MRELTVKGKNGKAAVKVTGREVREAKGATESKPDKAETDKAVNAAGQR